MKIAFFGSSLVSAYWNGAATYYRGLLHALAKRGHEIEFYEPDAYHRQQHRDIDDPPWARVHVYQPNSSAALKMVEKARDADLLVKASGVGVLDSFLEHVVLDQKRPNRLVAFWDVDAPATLERLALDPSDPFARLIPQFDLVFTYGGGHRVVQGYTHYGACECHPIYNGLDPTVHFPVAPEARFESHLTLLANRLPDREDRIESFFIEPARLSPHMRFRIGGNGWDEKLMPSNVVRMGHVYSADHNAVNCSALAVMNIHRDSMIRFGYSPATRLFEAAGAGACLVTDAWEGIYHFFEPGREVLVAESGEQVAEQIRELTRERAREMGQRALKRARAHHTYDQRALEVEQALAATGKPFASSFAMPAVTLAPPAEERAPKTARAQTIAVIGLSITSSWGNGHATTYRGLLRALAQQGHQVSFYEQDVPWYAENRDQPQPPGVEVRLYQDPDDLQERWGTEIVKADVVIVGSYVPHGQGVINQLVRRCRGVVAFYDIDTPVTMEALAAGTCEYLSAKQIPMFDLYLSFSGGRALEILETRYRAQRARALYCSFDPEVYRPVPVPNRWDLNYMGTYSADRQPALEDLLLHPARRALNRRFAVAGPQYPSDIDWPANVGRLDHVAPAQHAAFYCGARFTLNITRAAMRKIGWSPSVRLFEAAGCGVPIISDAWEGIEDVLVPGVEIAVARTTDDVLQYLQDMPETQRQRLALAARAKCLAKHSSVARANELLSYVNQVQAPAANPVANDNTVRARA